MMGAPFDPWQLCKTRSGLAADLVISALQKEIRRNNVENAAVLAYEMFTTSIELEEYLWFRLRTISVEDIGFADPQAPILIGILDQMRRNPHGGGDRWLLAIHAVRYLCQAKKDRSSDEMLNWIKLEYEQGNLKAEIPPYAVDKHTGLGLSQGKGDAEFYLNGAVVEPEWGDRDKTYRERIMKILDIKEDSR